MRGSTGYDAGYAQADLNTVDSPLQGFREVLDLMPAESDEDWSAVAVRLAAERARRWAGRVTPVSAHPRGGRRLSRRRGRGR